MAELLRAVHAEIGAPREDEPAVAEYAEGH
jgi:hypothetical protein